MTRSLLNAFRRRAFRSKDALRYCGLTCRLFVFAQLGRMWRSRNRTARLTALAEAYRVVNAGPLERRLRRSFHRIAKVRDNAWRVNRIGWSRYGTASNEPLDRTIILKAPGSGGERGALLLMLEYNWLRLLAQLDPRSLRRIDDDYDLVLSTGWSPTDYALLSLAAESLRHPVFVQACNHFEMERIRRLHPRLRCLPTLACDWINPDYYRPKPTARREIDLLMVANWAPFKRHWHLFEALARMPSNLRITLIGQPEAGHTVEEIKQQAALFGVRQDVEFLDQVSIDVVQRYQENSRASVILSRREGCCVAVCESLFAGSPVGMLRDAHVGPRAYINERTGVLLEHRRLDRGLMRLIEEAETFEPRDWANEHISCYTSTQSLNERLRANAESLGCPWVHDVRPVCWRPYPRHVHADAHEALRPVYAELHDRHPYLFPQSLFMAVQPPTSTVKGTRRTPDAATAPFSTATSTARETITA